MSSFNANEQSGVQTPRDEPSPRSGARTPLTEGAHTPPLATTPRIGDTPAPPPPAPTTSARDDTVVNMKPTNPGGGPRARGGFWNIMPKIPRKNTAMSFPSEGSEGGSYIGPGENQEVQRQTGTKPKLVKGGSKISFSSWRSGGGSSAGGSSQASSASSIISKKIMDALGNRTHDVYLAEGERHIMFEETGASVLPATLNDVAAGQPNRVRTAKFTLITWLPKSLYAQFQRVANVYFLCIVVLVMFPWSPKDWKSKVGPFCIVLLWTALKDIHEDSRRRRDDFIENNQKTDTFDEARKCFKPAVWQDIKVGDLVLVRRDHPFPADLIYLYGGSGMEAYISTISLDGETNLKERRPPGCWKSLRKVAEGDTHDATRATTTGDDEEVRLSAQEEIANAHELCLKLTYHLHTEGFTINMGKPETVVNEVRGVISSDTHNEMPMNATNFLPRGCTLRNTPWVLALVVYVGDDTKTRLNTAKSKGKMSNIQKYLNMCVWGLLVMLLLLCIYAASMATLQEGGDFEFCCSDESYLVRLGIFMITFYHVVPMSLYVCFEIMKLILTYLVNNDKTMVDPDTGAYAVARTSDLIEEMGQINFMFSDKTGTLTKNEMVFARACVGGKDLGDFRRASGSTQPSESAQKIHDALFTGSRGEGDTWLQDVSWYFTCLATCNSVQVSKDVAHGGKLLYQGMSPDEVALVEAAQDVGIVFQSRSNQRSKSSSTASDVTVRFGDDVNKVYSILYELEFTSDRKRMSVVLRQGSEHLLITKGADIAIEPLLEAPFTEADKDHLAQYSKQGLRTLVVAYKKLDKHHFRAWEKEYKKAMNIIDSTKNAEIARVQAEMEHDLTFAGLTAVEDCLQDGVPEAIATIKGAGVRVWVLTGDKTETAVDIARSCQLFTSSSVLGYGTEAKTEEEAYKALVDAKGHIQGSGNAGLVLDGKTVGYILDSERCSALLLELGLASRSCVCCRLNPLQKRRIIETVQAYDRSLITLAIGDGANDVPMIEGAHLGVGIRGKEGAQAVQVSDVAISQFRFLVPLLLCHGRRAYRRVSLFLCFYLYKNVALLMGDVVWMHMDKFAGRIAFPEYVSINYNVAFTSWHILFVLGFDVDVTDEVAVSNPLLYHVGPERQLFNKYVFTAWMLSAVYHGVAAWLIASFFVIDGAPYHKDEPGRFWEGSITALSIIILCVCGKLLVSSQSPFKFKTSILPTLGALLLYVIAIGCISYMPPFPDWQPCMYGLIVDFMQNVKALIVSALAPLVILSVDIAATVAKKKMHPTALDLAKAAYRSGHGVDQGKSNVQAKREESLEANGAESGSP